MKYFNWLWVSCFMAATVGCGDGLEKFPVAKARGKVLCDGQPVPHVMVFFEPIKSGNSAIVGKPGFADADENGEFVLSTYGRGDGAVVGEHRVRVDRPSGEDYPDFQCDCRLTDLKDVTQVNVTEGGENEFVIELPKASRQDRRMAQQAMADAVDEREDD